MRLRIITILIALFFSCAYAHKREKICLPKLANLTPLEHAIMYEGVARVQTLMRAGHQLTAHACELAGHHIQVVELIYQYLEDAIEQYRAGAVLAADTVVNLSRAHVCDCLNALLLHTYDVNYIRALLLLGARADYVDAVGHNALFYARQKGHEDTARILLHEDEKNYAQLLEHVKQKKLTYDFLKKYFSGVNRMSINRAYAELDWHTVLYLAVKQNDYEGTKLLLDFGAASIQDVFPVALRFADKKVIQLLISRGARLHRVPEFLSLIVRENQYAYPLVAWLMSVVNRDQLNNALVQACLQGREALVVLLLNGGASTVYHDRNGVTPLWAAVVGHDLSIVQRILARTHTSLTPEHVQTTKTLFPAAYELLRK